MENTKIHLHEFVRLQRIDPASINTGPLLNFLLSQRIDPTTFGLGDKSKSELLEWCARHNIAVPARLIRNHVITAWRNSTDQVVRFSIFLAAENYLDYVVGPGETVEILAEYDAAIPGLAPQLEMVD